VTATVSDAELVTAAQFAEARERLHGAVLHTPLVQLTSVTDTVAYLKPESLQPIGSFKLRGAYNAVAQLSEAARRRGCRKLRDLCFYIRTAQRKRCLRPLTRESGSAAYAGENDGDQNRQSIVKDAKHWQAALPNKLIMTEAHY